MTNEAPGDRGHRSSPEITSHAVWLYHRPAPPELRGELAIVDVPRAELVTVTLSYERYRRPVFGHRSTISATTRWNTNKAAAREGCLLHSLLIRQPICVRAATRTLAARLR